MTEKDELIQELKGKVESLEKANKILKETSVDIIEMCEKKRLLDKLTEYQKLEEQGLLLKIPCKTGDMVYRINEYASGDYCEFCGQALDWTEEGE